MSKKKLWTLPLAILAGVFYRMGGSEHWNTKARDIGVPLVATIWLLLFTTWRIWPLVVHFGLLFGALTTYEYFLPDNPKKGPLNWLLHGFFSGLAAIPLIWCGIAWWLILARAVILAVTMTAWSEAWKWDIAEEWGRGALVVLSLLILRA